jgi:hypothetical protein
MMTVEELLDFAIAHSRDVLIGKAGAELVPTWLVQLKDRPAMVLATPWDGEDEKCRVIDAIRMMLKSPEALSYSFLSEAWVANEDGRYPTGLMPSQREDKREVVIINACNRQSAKMRIYEMKRDARGRVSDLVKDPEKGVERFEGRLFNLFADD